MNEPPRVTVLMPVYNAGDYLDAAVESILGQTHTDFELLIVDDGSDAPTAKRIDDWAGRDARIRVVRNAVNLGVTRALNRGLAEAKGEFVARQDADDISLSQRLRAQLDFLDRNPRHVVVGCDCALIDDDGRVTRIDSMGWADYELRLISMVRTPIVHSSAMFRLGPVREHGLRYDERYHFGEDFDFWARIQAYGDLAVVPELLVHYRLHDAAISSRRRAEQRRNMHDIAMRYSFECLPELNPQRAQVEAFFELLYLQLAPTADRIAMACDGATAIATAFERASVLTRGQRFRVRRLCARWLAMGVWRSKAWLRPRSLLPLLRRSPLLAAPLSAELADFVRRRIGGRLRGA